MEQEEGEKRNKRKATENALGSLLGALAVPRAVVSPEPADSLSLTLTGSY